MEGVGAAMATNQQIDEQGNDLGLGLALGIIATLIIVYIVIPAFRSQDDIAAKLTYQQYASEVMHCTKARLNALSTQDLREIVSAYRIVTHEPGTGMNTQRVIAKIDIYDPHVPYTNVRHIDITGRFDAYGCGFVADVNSYGLYSTTVKDPKKLPRGSFDTTPIITYLDTHGRKVQPASGKACFSNAFPFGITSKNHIEGRMLCSRELMLLGG